MIMEEQKRDTLPPQPGLIDAFSAGFDLTANNVAVILLPLLFDLFLWLGPHLRISNIIRPFITNMVAFAPMAGVGSSDLLLVQAFWNDFAERFNVFALARTMPVGVPSLLSGSLPLKSPLSAPTFIEVGGAGSFLFYWVVLAFAGWVLGAVFFNWVARITSPNKLAAYFPFQYI